MASVTQDQVAAFCRIDTGYGNGNGNGSGYGNGDGDGDGSGNGSGYGNGDGDGDGSGNGSGYGNGYGDGYGYGYGSGYGSGSGSGYGDGVLSINNMSVRSVDSIATVFEHIHGNVARVRIMTSDLALSPPGYLIRQGNLFAHGETLRKAQEALIEKLFEDMPEEERIDAFVVEYPRSDIVALNANLFDWHHRLTGSCEQGRMAFAKDHGIDLDGEMTVSEFIRLTRDSYGSQIIRDLEARYQ